MSQITEFTVSFIPLPRSHIVLGFNESNVLIVLYSNILAFPFYFILFIRFVD